MASITYTQLYNLVVRLLTQKHEDITELVVKQLGLVAAIQTIPYYNFLGYVVLNTTEKNIIQHQLSHLDEVGEFDLLSE